MARFRVGQRVKKVRGERGVGLTGRVSSEPVSFINELYGADITVRVNEFSVASCGGIIKPGDLVATKAYEWEPVIPSGHKPAELTVEELLPFLKTREVSDVAL